MRRRTAVFLGTVVLLVAAVILVLNRDGAAPTDTEHSDQDAGQEVMLTQAQIARGKIRWQPAQAQLVAGATEVAGKLVADDDRTSRIGAPTQGRVLRVYAQLGDAVRRGQPLVALQSPEASSTRADYDRAVAESRARQAALEYARIARERAERLLAAKAIARQDVERARAEEAMARAELARTQSDVRRASSGLGQWEITDAAGTMLLRAPRSGVVLTREAVPGTVVEAGMPLVTVSDISQLWLDAAVPEREASALAVGAPVRFTVPAFPADTMAGRVRAIGGALDPQARRIIVRATVPNPSARLRPEMYATVWIESGGQRRAIVIPEAAVQLMDGKTVAFVAMPMADGVHFQRRDVQLGASIGSLVEVKSGIAVGEQVVVAGAFAVKSELSRASMPAMDH